MSKLIEINNLSKVFGKNENEFKALNNISLTINEGEMIAIIGTSGSGKSTLLNILGCLDTATSGEYKLNSENINKFSEKKLANVRNSVFGFVVQYFALIDEYTVYKNVAVPLIYSSSKIKNKRIKIDELLDKLNILNKKSSYPNNLSGGQCQRVAIARALINDPKIILADEPTGALDKNNTTNIMELFLEFNKEGKTIIIVTHDEEIACMCNRIIRLEDGLIVDDIANNLTSANLKYN